MAACWLQFRGEFLAATMALIIGPWFVWNPSAMVDDVWRWSAGTAQQAQRAQDEGIPTAEAADRVAEQRIQKARHLQRSWV